MDDPVQRQALAEFLRTRRARLRPADVGLPEGRRRRTPGLRREEVAELANIGVSWYTLLEQGHDVHPSRQVLAGLAGALRLDAAERQHLFLLAGEQTAADLPLDEEPGPALRRLVERLDPDPAYLIGRRWDLLAWNRAAEEIFHYSTIAPPHSCNLMWRIFATPVLQEDYAYWETIARRFVARFRADSARYPGDPWFAELIADLEQTETPFKAWWRQHDVRGLGEGHKLAVHPRLGPLEFEHVTLQVPANPGIRLVVYTPLPDTAARLDHLLDPDPGEGLPG